MNEHLSDHQLLSYLENHQYRASPGERERVEAHLRTCSTCRARLERLARTAADLSTTLHTVGAQVPLSPARSWEGVAQRWRRERPRTRDASRTGARSRELPFAGSFALLRAGSFAPLVRHAATLTVLVLIVAGLAGLIHTLAVTGPVLPRPTPTAIPTPPASPSPPPGPLPRPVADGSNWSYRSAPVTLLVLGSDAEAATSDRTDALMLLYLDASAGRAFVLSIPRDLYVDVPALGQASMASVYGLGERREEGRGLALARETVSATLSLPLQHAALVRLESFVALVDAIGGVDVEVPYAIEDANFPDGQGGYDPLSIPAGTHHLEGELALRYARTRVVPAPGFDRAFRQQQLVLAAHERVTRLELLPGLIAQAPALWASVSQGLETDLSLSDMIDLALLAADVGAGDIASATLEGCCTVPYVTPAGERVRLPQKDEIQALLEGLLEGER